LRWRYGDTEREKAGEEAARYTMQVVGWYIMFFLALYPCMCYPCMDACKHANTLGGTFGYQVGDNKRPIPRPI
jgi:hypothetical protein